jgi:hypothetical protein
MVQFALGVEFLKALETDFEGGRIRLQQALTKCSQDPQQLVFVLNGVHLWVAVFLPQYRAAHATFEEEFPVVQNQLGEQLQESNFDVRTWSLKIKFQIKSCSTFVDKFAVTHLTNQWVNVIHA